ncbi:hypothetical protein ACFLTR_00045 [Chloroflexota bacterium]
MERQTPASGRRRRASPVSCANAVREDFEGGFFDKSRLIRETKQRLTKRGMTCTDDSIRIALNRLYKNGLMDRVKEGGLLKYHRKG